MTAKESGRESYHHGDLRQAILEAACQHLRAQNTDSLSLRALARKIGVSQTAPYRHFDSRNALFAGIAVWGFNILEQELRQTLADDTGPASEKLVELGLTYLKFSQAHFEKYSLLYASNLVDFEEYEELQAAGSRSFDLMLQTIRQGREEGLFLDRPEEELAAVIWSGLHGMASLLQLDSNSEKFGDRPVSTAVKCLVNQQREMLQSLVSAIRR
jgi:AcrR family transcriptional regulator